MMVVEYGPARRNDFGEGKLTSQEASNRGFVRRIQYRTRCSANASDFVT